MGSPVDLVDLAKLLGFCETLEWGEGFLHIRGWIARSDKSRVTGRIDIRINELTPFSVEDLAYRSDLELSGIAEGCGGFATVIITQTPLADSPNVYVRMEGGPEVRLPFLENAVRPYAPEGAFYHVTTDYVSGWIFDCGNWLTGATASLVLDGKFVIPLNLEPEQNSTLVTLIGDFPHSMGGYATHGFLIAIDEILQKIWEQDFDAPIIDSEIHDLKLVSSGYEVARARIASAPLSASKSVLPPDPSKLALPVRRSTTNAQLSLQSSMQTFTLRTHPTCEAQKLTLLITICSMAGGSIAIHLPPFRPPSTCGETPTSVKVGLIPSFII